MGKAFLSGCATQGIVAPGAQWEEVSRAGRVFGEGAVAAKDGRIYASDITPTAAIKENNPGGTIWRYDPATGQTEKYMEPSGQSNGLHVDKNGDLIIVQGADGGGRSVLRRNLSTGATTVLAGGYQGKKFNSLNDVTSDARGRIYFTDPRFFGSEPLELPNTAYRVDPDGRITDLKPGLERPNGIEVSPDGRTLYIATTNGPNYQKNPHGPARDAFLGDTDGGVVAFDLDADGNSANGRVIFRNSGGAGRRHGAGYRRQYLYRDAQRQPEGADIERRGHRPLGRGAGAPAAAEQCAVDESRLWPWRRCRFALRELGAAVAAVAHQDPAPPPLLRIMFLARILRFSGIDAGIRRFFLIFARTIFIMYTCW